MRGIFLGHFAGGADHQAAGFAQHVGLIADGDAAAAVALGELEGFLDDATAALAGHDAQRDGEVVEAVIAELLHLLVGGGERIEDRLRQRMEFHAAVHAFGVLAEDDDVDAFLVVQRVAGIGLGGADVGVQVQFLAQADDGREVVEALAAQFGQQFFVGFVARLGGDRAEQRAFGLLQDLAACGREGRCLRGSRIPSRYRRGCIPRRIRVRRDRCVPLP